MFSFSPMNNLSKYYCHLCLISSSFTSNQSIIINAFNLIEVSRLPFMNPSHSICPSILCLYLCVGKYPHRHDPFTTCFAIFFVTLNFSTLSTLLSWYKYLQHSLFFLIAFQTSLFLYQVSLGLRPLVLVTPNTFEATFQIHVAIFTRTLFASSPSFQKSSLITFLLKDLLRPPPL